LREITIGWAQKIEGHAIATEEAANFLKARENFET
jgi:hypothetical protein